MTASDPMRPAERHLARSSGLFRGLAGRETEAILDRAELRLYAEREVVCRQGDEVPGLCLVVGGRVKLSQLGAGGGEVIIRFVGPGEVFAAVAALDRAMRLPVTAAALSPVRIAYWPRPVIQEIFRTHPALSSRLLEQIADRAQEFQSRLREVATERVPQRLAHMLLRLARQAGRPVDGGTLIDFPLTRRDLAEMIGTTLYTVSRLMTAWSERGILEIGRGRVVVRSEAGLEEVAADPG